MSKRHLLLTSFCINVLIFFFCYLFYSPDPSRELISSYLNGKYFLSNLELLGNQKPFPLNFVFGPPQLTFPSIIIGLIPQSFSWLIFMPNLILITISQFLIVKKIVSKNNQFFILFLCFSLTPFFLQTIFSSISSSLLIFLITTFFTSSSVKVKITSLLLSIFSSPLIWLISPVLAFKITKIPKLNLLLSAIFLTIILLLILPSRTAIFSSWLSSFNPLTYRFQTDIHRQSELNAGVPWLGKLLYNKYLVIPGEIMRQTASYLDWDRYLFIGHSGKSENRPLDKPQFFFLDLFFIFFAIYCLRKNLKAVLIALLSSAMMAVVIKADLDTGILLWLILSSLTIFGYYYFWKKNHRIFYLMLPIIFLGRLVYLHLGLRDNLGFPRFYSAYLEAIPFISNSPYQIFFTDRMGIPHLYLSYLKEVKIEDLSQSLINLKTKDKDGWYQPSSIGHLSFGSFNYDSLKTGLETKQNALFFEYKNIFPEEQLKQIEFSKTFGTPLTFQSKIDQTETTYLTVVKTK